MLGFILQLLLTMTVSIITATIYVASYYKFLHKSDAAEQGGSDEETTVEEE